MIKLKDLLLLEDPDTVWDRELNKTYDWSSRGTYPFIMLDENYCLFGSEGEAHYNILYSIINFYVEKNFLITFETKNSFKDYFVPKLENDDIAKKYADQLVENYVPSLHNLFLEFKDCKDKNEQQTILNTNFYSGGQLVSKIRPPKREYTDAEKQNQHLISVVAGLRGKQRSEKIFSIHDNCIYKHVTSDNVHMMRYSTQHILGRVWISDKVISFWSHGADVIVKHLASLAKFVSIRFCGAKLENFKFDIKQSNGYRVVSYDNLVDPTKTNISSTARKLSSNIKPKPKPNSEWTSSLKKLYKDLRTPTRY
jgi:hypothetical protein